MIRKNLFLNIFTFYYPFLTKIHFSKEFSTLISTPCGKLIYHVENTFKNYL